MSTPPTATSKQGALPLIEDLRALRRGWIVLVVGAVAGAAVGLVASQVVTLSYSAESTTVLDTIGLAGLEPNNVVPSAQDVDRFVRSDEFEDDVRAQLDEGAADLVAGVSVRTTNPFLPRVQVIGQRSGGNRADVVAAMTAWQQTLVDQRNEIAAVASEVRLGLLTTRAALARTEFEQEYGRFEPLAEAAGYDPIALLVQESPIAGNPSPELALALTDILAASRNLVNATSALEAYQFEVGEYELAVAQANLSISEGGVSAPLGVGGGMLFGLIAAVAIILANDWFRRAA